MCISLSIILNNKLDDNPKQMFWMKRRIVVAVLASYGFFNVYAFRTCLSVAIVAMTTTKTTVLGNITVFEEPEFDWNSKLRGYILSSNFYGYTATPIFGGWLSTKFGGKHVFGVAIIGTGILNSLIPLSSGISVYLLIFVRILQGMFEGLTHPGINAMWSNWVPPLERTTVVTIALTGTHVGTIVSIVASAWLTDTFGWPTPFYVFGIITLIWFILWLSFIGETPADDKKISVLELEYIQKSVGNAQTRHNVNIPWKAILTSVPVWSIIAAGFADYCITYIILTELPTYLNDKFNNSISKTGLFSALPHLAKTVMNLLSGKTADWLLKKQIFTTVQVRKIFTCGAFIAEAMLLVVTNYVSSFVGTILCLTVSVAIGVCSQSGYRVNILDIAPQHAGVLAGFTNTMDTTAGIFVTTLTGYIVTGESVNQWQIVFNTISVILAVASVLYGFLAKGEVQIQ
ncbi:sialin-like [Zophobas morio]|uniref:sialin-like n=1 Tax=Zophobas morio TaxID=2755281 RepID=UPI0030829756